MDNGILATNFIMQIGIVVNDIERTSQAYADFFGIERPQWFWSGDLRTVYEGAPTEARAKLAVIHMENLQLELVEPDHHPSIWRNHLDTRGEGLLHIGFSVKEIDRKIDAMEADGMPLVHKGDFQGGSYAFMDSFRQLKLHVLLEHLESDQ